MTIPNIITFIRILFVPVFIHLLVNHQSTNIPGIVFVGLAITDMLDGFIARLFKMKTQLGAFLDAFADKLLILSSYLVLTCLTKVPVWFFTVIVGRDIIVFLGWVLILILTGSSAVRPGFLGKISIVFEMATLCILLFEMNSLINTFFYLTTLMTVVSIIDYIIKGSKRIVPVA
ncbi:MAG: hypothetical protein AUJ85_06665 [Elusimicrobia bacterium CG1_02_37_114]|nr:MAG: hypothetical protein AUJ85_06665 [Elusimicrobia bacterium CG1_02_37_114]